MAAETRDATGLTRPGVHADKIPGALHRMDSQSEKQLVGLVDDHQQAVSYSPNRPTLKGYKFGNTASRSRRSMHFGDSSRTPHPGLTPTRTNWTGFTPTSAGCWTYLLRRTIRRITREENDE